MSRPDPWAPVRAWHAAVNAGDAEAAAVVASPDVRLGGPRGAAAGLDALREWVAGAGIRLAPVAWHPVGPDAVVVEEDATWPARGAPEPVRVFTAYVVRDGRVAAALRHDSIEAARRAVEASSGPAAR